MEVLAKWLGERQACEVLRPPEEVLLSHTQEGRKVQLV